MFKQKKFYNNIKGLLKCDIELEYTEEQITEIIKCTNDIEYFLKTYVKVIHQDRGKVPFQLYDFQKKFIQEIENNRNILGLISRQAGKTVGISGYILHYVIFNKDKNVGIVANKGSTARKILKGIKNMYKSLPEWLQVGVEEWNKGNIILGNGCQVMTDNTSSDSFTGEAISLLIVDEVAKIEGNLFKDFFDSAMPTVSSSKSSKVIMFSTAKGLNHWYKLWKDAENGVNGFYPFQIEWDEVPGRDNAWRDQIIQKFGETHFLQEYDNKFLGSSNSLISMIKLQSMPHDQVLELQNDDHFRIYEYPIKELEYFLLCDYGEGVEQDSSTVQVFKRIEDGKFTQVAVYNDNISKPREFAKVKKMVGEYYNMGMVIGEANSIGQESLNELAEELEYDNILYDPATIYLPGIKKTKKTKKLGNTYLKQNVEKDIFEIVDFETIQQLSTYIKKGISYEADTGCHDDLISPLVTFSDLLNRTDFTDNYLDDYDMRVNDTQKEEDDIIPGFMYDGNKSFAFYGKDEDEDGYGEEEYEIIRP